MATLQEKPVEITLIILNYSTAQLTTQLLQKLGNDERREIIVIDNSNQKDLAEIVHKNFPYVIYITPETNLGFSGGNNLGIHKANGEWILLLNSDTIADGNMIRDLLSITKQHKFLVSAPKLLYKNHEYQKNVGYFDDFITHPINWFFARPRFITAPRDSKPISVDFATGACILLHKNVFKKVGLFDDKRFFLYFEDIDFCYRLKNYSIPVLYVPEITITHLEGQSSFNQTAQKKRYYNEGLCNYLKKHRTVLSVWINKIFPVLR